MKVLLWDTETSPNTVYTWGLWNQNVALNQIIDTSRLLCVCAKWLGDTAVHSLAEWDYTDRQQFLLQIWKLLDEADAVVSYNGKGFDSKVVRREFVVAGLPPPSPYAEIDLYQTVKRNFRFASNKLDHVASQLGLGNKVRHEGFEMWVKAMNGDKQAQQDMLTYCVQDTRLLEPLYRRLLPWIHNHPNPALYEHKDDMSCTKCGSDDIHRRGFAYTKTMKYARYRCKSCGSWSQERLSCLDKDERENILKSCA